MKKILLLPLFCLLIVSQIVAQPARRAQKHMKLYNYSKAVRILSKAVEKPRHKESAIPLLAECYRLQQDVFNTKAWYARAIKLPGAKPEWYYYYAQALRTSGDYMAASEMFKDYAKLNPADKKALLLAAYCDSAANQWKNQAPGFEVKSVNGINSGQSDFGPAFINGMLAFSSDRNLNYDESNYGWTGRGYLDIFSSKPAAPGEFWGDMKAPASFKGKFNQTFHDGPAFFLENQVVYFTRTYNDKAGKKDNVRTNLLKIFFANYENGKWGNLQPFFLNSTDFSVGHPTLTADGKTICFASDMPGGEGGTDLWICQKEGENWSQPVNMGPEINTPGNEMFPSIQADGRLIYSSDLLPGFGGLDLFCSKPAGNTWGKPANLGTPLNSSFDDFALNFAPNAKNGFFSSNRPGGMGSDDIYAFRKIDIPEPVKPTPVETPKPAYLTGVVKDKTNMQPIEGATVFIFNPNTGKVKVLKTGPDGKYTLEIERGAEYTVKAMKPKFISDCTPVSVNSVNPGNTYQAGRDLLLDKLEVNKTFKIENIYYDFDKYEIRADAKPELDKLVRIMNENPINVELGSHTDSRGSFAYNDKLSQNRAQSAVNYIVSTGISQARITAKGYGEHKLTNQCADGVKCTDEEHQANRRTEFKVTGYTAPTSIMDQFDPEKFANGEELDARLMPGAFFNPCK